MKISKSKQESSIQGTEQKVRCPNCGHTVFSRTSVEPVEIVKTKDIVTDVLADEPQLVNEFYCCVKCGSILDLDEGVGSNAQTTCKSTNDLTAAAQDELARYVACVFEPTDIVEVRRLPSCKSTWHQAEELIKAAVSLVKDNQQNQHIYVGANPRRSRGGTKGEGVACARCLFVDFDGISPDIAREKWQSTGLPTPTLTIASGHGVHAYWRLAEPITDMTLWTGLQKRFIALLGSDSAIHDPARIMRLPGFINYKEPVAACRIIDDDHTRVYELKTLISSVYSVITEADYAAQYRASYGNKTCSEERRRNDMTALNVANLTAARWPGITEGERNCKAFQNAAYLLKNLGLREEQAWPILRGWNARNKPPLPEQELRQALRNARTYGRHPVGSKVA